MKNERMNPSNLLAQFLISLVMSVLYILKMIGDGILTIGKNILILEYAIITLVFSITTKIVPAIKAISIRVIIRVYRLLRNIFPQEGSANKNYRLKSSSPRTIFQSRYTWKWNRLTLPKLRIMTRLKDYLASFTFYLLLVKIKYFLFGGFVILIITVSFRLHGLISSLPNPNYLSLRDIATTTKIFDRTGILLYEYFAQENRIPISLSEVPKPIIDATLAIEDKDFYSHQGISSRGILRAILHNINSSSLEGGSTITQQLVRSALLSPERTIQRKIVEIVLAVWTERLYSKDQILEMYLNQVPYGGTAWGIEAASNYYFGKSTKEITLAEAALLAGLPAAPTFYSPFGNHPQLALTRQKEVLNRMVEADFITQEEADAAKHQTLSFQTPTTPILAPHFVMFIQELLNSYYGANVIAHEGLRVTTSLDLSLQEMAENVVVKNIVALRPLHVGNAAALITNPKNGEILSMVGSPNYFDIPREGNVNLTRALRQPGSSIKIVTYAEALTQGFTPASILYDTPVTYKVDSLPAYSPVNYDGSFHGAVPLRVALGSSYNVPAVKTLALIGIKNMIERARLMGITSWSDESRFGLSLTLGGGEVTMLDMAKVYGVLANSGKRHDLTPILKITDWQGNPLPLPTRFESVQAVSPQVAYLLAHILSDNSARTSAFGPNSALHIPGKTVAVKTGTSDSKRDNWTIGFTPDYVTTVWVGNNDNSPMDQKLTSGVTGAAPIWREIMLNLLKDKPDQPFLQPENIVTLPCLGRQEVFIKGTEPKGGCTPIPTIPVSPSPHR